jgi:hypothetical protein
MTLYVILGSNGLGHSYYLAGDIQGLGGEHDVSLLAGAVTATRFGITAFGRWVPVSAIGTIATIATGVRSTLPLTRNPDVESSKSGVRAGPRGRSTDCSRGRIGGGSG